MARQCLGLLYAVWTGQTMAHWLAGVGPRTSPLGGQWLQRQQTGAEMKDGWSPPHRGQEDPLPQRVPGRQPLEQGGRASGGPHWRCFAGWRGRASHHRRARSPRRGPDHLDPRAVGLALQEEKWKERGRERKRQRKHVVNYQMRHEVEKVESGRNNKAGKLIGVKQTEIQSRLREERTRVE